MKYLVYEEPQWMILNLDDLKKISLCCQSKYETILQNTRAGKEKLYLFGPSLQEVQSSLNVLMGLAEIFVFEKQLPHIQV